MSKWSVHPIKAEPSGSKRVVIKVARGSRESKENLHWGQHPIYYGAAEPIVKRKAFPLKRDSDRKPNNEASNTSEEISLDVKLKTN